MQGHTHIYKQVFLQVYFHIALKSYEGTVSMCIYALICSCGQDCD